MITGLTAREILALPATTDIVTAGRALGISRALAYELAATDSFPCKVLRLGTRYRVVTADLLEQLGITPDMPVSAPDLGAPTAAVPTTPTKDEEARLDHRSSPPAA